MPTPSLPSDLQENKLKFLWCYKNFSRKDWEGLVENLCFLQGLSMTTEGEARGQDGRHNEIGAELSLSGRKYRVGELFSALACYKGDLLTSLLSIKTRLWVRKWKDPTQNPSPSARNVKIFTYFQYSGLERFSTPSKSYHINFSKIPPLITHEKVVLTVGQLPVVLPAVQWALTDDLPSVPVNLTTVPCAMCMCTQRCVHIHICVHAHMRIHTYEHHTRFSKWEYKSILHWHL